MSGWDYRHAATSVRVHAGINNLRCKHCRVQPRVMKSIGVCCRSISRACTCAASPRRRDLRYQSRGKFQRRTPCWVPSDPAPTAPYTYVNKKAHTHIYIVIYIYECVFIVMDLTVHVYKHCMYFSRLLFIGIFTHGYFSICCVFCICLFVSFMY